MKKRRFFFLFFNGLLNGISISILILFPVIIFTYFNFIKILINETSLKRNFFNGWVFGSGFFLGSMYWIVSPFLVYEKHYIFAPFILILFPLLMGLFFCFPAVCTSILNKKINLKSNSFLYLKSFVLSLFFFFSEILRSKLFGGLPLNLTAHILAFNSSLIQFGKIFGVFGVSFLTLNWFIILANSILKKQKKTFFAIIFFVPASLIIFDKFSNHILQKNDHNKLKVRVVQPNIPQEKKWDRLYMQEHIDKLIYLTNKNNVDEEKKLIVWPEVAVTFYLNKEYELQKYIQDRIPENFTLVTGALRRDFSKGRAALYNSLYLIQGEKVFIYDKKRLVPFGEFIPLRNFFDLVKLTPGSTDYSSGKGNNKMLVEIGNQRIDFEPSICYEAIFQTFSYEEVSLLINITNDAWFGNFSGPKQHLAASIFRSVEKGIPLLRSANSGISVITNERGKILETIDLNESGFIDLEITLGKNLTPFMRFGNLMVLILIFSIMMASLLMDGIIFNFKKRLKTTRI